MQDVLLSNKMQASKHMYQLWEGSRGSIADMSAAAEPASHSCASRLTCMHETMELVLLPDDMFGACMHLTAAHPLSHAR